MEGQKRSLNQTVGMCKREIIEDALCWAIRKYIRQGIQMIKDILVGGKNTLGS